MKFPACRFPSFTRDGFAPLLLTLRARRAAALACGSLSILLLSLLTVPVTAQEPHRFDDPAKEARFLVLTEELRCVVCQNQSLADSDAPLAHDLRQEIHDMLQAGRSDAEIKSFLVERYGDFVLYRPPVKGNTLALWLMPAVLLLGGAIALGVAVRRRRNLPADPPTDSGPGPDGRPTA